MAIGDDCPRTIQSKVSQAMSDGAASGEHEPPAIRLLLVGLQSPINLGMILRVAETFRIGVGILHSDALLDDAERMRTVSDFACGALQRVGYVRKDPRALPVEPGRRLIATTIEPEAVPLPDFRFAPGDVIALGNEYDGLDARIEAAAAARLSIPMADVFTPKPASARPIDPTRRTPPARDGRPNLNVAIAAGIVCYAAFQAIGDRPSGGARR